MAINFDALKKKLDSFQGRNSTRDLMWRPTEGEESVVRLIAYPNNDGLPFAERWFYYNIGRGGILAPSQFGKPDPINELHQKLRNSNDDAQRELASKLRAKVRYYAPVVVRGEEEKGVRLWAFSKTVYQSLANFMLGEFGDITDIDAGHDVAVSSSKPPGRQWATTSVMPRIAKTPLTTNATHAKQWLNALPNLDEIYQLQSYEEIASIVNNWLNTPEDSSNDGSYRGSTNTTSTANDETAPEMDSFSKKFNDLSDAFKGL